MESQDLSQEAEDSPETDSDDSWKSVNAWVWLASHRQLRHLSREVVLEHTSELFGREVRTVIPAEGKWVWKPDADRILELGPLASCRGMDDRIRRPFFVASTPRKHRSSRPSGAPQEE